MKMRSLVMCVALAAVSGCSSKDEVDIGDEGTAKTGEKLSDYADVWEGYVEAHEFGDGSDRIRVVLDDEGNGTLIVGEAAEPSAEVAPLPDEEGLVPGFPYTITAGSVADKRLRFWAHRNEAFKPFCEAQASVPFIAGPQETYSCLPNAASGSDGRGICWIQVDGEPKQYLDCSHVDACWNVCACTSEACGIREVAPSDESASYFAKVDAALTEGGDELFGTFAPFGDTRLSVRLMRQ